MCCEARHDPVAIAAFQRHAFAALLAGATPCVAEITEAASGDTLGVAHVVAWLEHHGQLERDGELLVGAHGLTRRITPHTLTIGAHPAHLVRLRRCRHPRGTRRHRPADNQLPRLPPAT